MKDPQGNWRVKHLKLAKTIVIHIRDDYKIHFKKVNRVTGKTEKDDAPRPVGKGVIGIKPPEKNW